MSSLRGRAWLKTVVVESELAVDDFGELAFEAAEGFGGCLVFGLFALVVRLAGPGVHGVWTRAAICRAWLSERLPARESRWRVCWPLEPLTGDVPVSLA